MHRQRSIVRPTSSSYHDGSASTVAASPRAKVKECCRKTVAFMCTQVGVGALIVVYAVVGAFSFISIETNPIYSSHNNHIDLVKGWRANCSHELWLKSEKYNVLDVAAWKRDVNEILKNYQDNLTLAIRMGYDGRTPKEVWSYPAALMFCLSVFSMIGYGNMAPRTQWGKGATVIYATFGIPLYILYFLNIGRVLARTFRCVYTWVHECSSDPDDEEEDGDRIEYVNGEALVVVRKKKIIVPSTACLWVMSLYILIGTVMFSFLDNWDYLNSWYFCVTSLCKIGFGDFVPGTASNVTISWPFHFDKASAVTTHRRGVVKPASNQQNHTKLVINFVYMLLGMGLVAMCYNLMREDVRVKLKEMKEDSVLCMEDLRVRLAKRFRGRQTRSRDVERQK